MAEKYFTDRDVAERFAMSRASVWRKSDGITLPKPVRLGHLTRWLESELDAADGRLKAQRDGEGA